MDLGFGDFFLTDFQMTLRPRNMSGCADNGLAIFHDMLRTGNVKGWMDMGLDF